MKDLVNALRRGNQKAFEYLSESVKVIGEAFFSYMPFFQHRFYGIDCFLAVKFANKYVSYMPSAT